jgi:ABC-type transport system involved in multi-copper enzyme maturation permease subunit
MSGVVVAETVRRHVTNVGYLSYIALVAMVGLAVSRFDQPAAVWPTLITLLSVITGAAIVGPEFSSGTLQLILVKPVNRASYVISRIAGVVAAVWLATLTAFAFECAGRVVRGDVPWRSLSISLVNVSADVVLTVSLLALLGSLTRAYFNAAIYVGLQIALSMAMGVLTMARKYPEVGRVLAVVEKNLFPEVPPRFDRDWMLLVFSNAAVAILLACIAFRNREVPYGAD